MKKLTLVLLLAFSMPVFAEPVITDGYEEKTPEATLKAIQDAFAKKFPQVKGDAFVNGSLNFNPGSVESNKMWTARMNDDFDQPVGYPQSIAAGKKLWETPMASGKTMSSCFKDGGKGAANEYPRVNETTGKVETFEKALNDCRVANGEKALDYGDMKTMGALSVIARQLSNGERINIQVKTPAQLAAFNRGKELFYGRFGTADQACASCHIQHAGDTARTEELSPAIGQAAHFPVYRLDKANDGLKLVSLHERYQGCQKSTGVAKPIKEGSDESNDMEYFHTYLSNGLPLSTGVMRK